MRRVGIFGWGVVAPRSPNIDAFAANLASAESWLQPFNGFGPDNFLVGVPEFRFADYRDWIASRFPPARFHQLEEKMDLPVLYAIGSFIQALGQNPGLEAELKALGTAAHVYMGTGLGCVQTVAKQHPRPRPRAAPVGPLLGRAQPGVPGSGGSCPPAPRPIPTRSPIPRTATRPRPPGGTTGPPPRPTSINTCASWPRSRG